MEEANTVTRPNFDRMTKEEVIAWFDAADDVSPILSTMTPAEPLAPATSEVPMALASIRLPVTMIEQLDDLADLDGERRSDISRHALAMYIAQRTAPVARDEAEYALDVLRRVVSNRMPPSAAA